MWRIFATVSCKPLLHFSPLYMYGTVIFLLFGCNRTCFAILAVLTEVSSILYLLSLKKSLLHSILVSILGTVASLLMIIMFGAKSDVLDAGSWFLAATIWLCVLCSWPQLKNRTSEAKWSIVSVLLSRLGLSLLGVWIGAILYVLDWDRSWQAWPNTCLMGLFAGHMLFGAVTMVKQII